ncbi:MAG: hypothetical protein R2844_01110 [Caldilineales bacterium]
MTRKETPDVLGELLAGPATDLPAQPTQPAPPPKPRRRRAAASEADDKQQAKQSKAAPVPKGWDYLIISFSDHRGWRPRYINGQEIRNWSQAPLIHDYLAQLGEDGWELVGAGGGKSLYGVSDYYQLFLKRARK